MLELRHFSVPIQLSGTMRSYPYDSGDLPSLSLRSDASAGYTDSIEVVDHSRSEAVEMSEAMMLMPPVSTAAAIPSDSGSYTESASNSSKTKSWDELASEAGAVLVSPSSSSSVVSDLSVMDSPFMEVIDMLLAGKSPEEEHLFLREMVVDLMTEVDNLKLELENSKRGFGSGIISNSNLFALLSKTIEPNPVSAAKKTVNEMIKKRDQPVSHEEAMEMVIQQLTKKIEEQNIRNSDYVSTIKKLDKQLDLFKTACRARGKKIEALQAELDKAKENARKKEEEETAEAKENKISGKNGAEFLLPVRTIAPTPAASGKSADRITAFNKVLNKPYAI